MGRPTQGEVIAFTGHRDKTADPAGLDRIADLYPGATWIHGGAVGFDTQVERYAKAHGIPTLVIRPDYARYGKPAPIIRNREIVDRANVVVACYDRRQYGGTAYTVGYAQGKGKPVVILEPVP